MNVSNLWNSSRLMNVDRRSKMRPEDGLHWRTFADHGDDVMTDNKRQKIYRLIDQIDKRLLFALIFLLESIVFCLDYLTSPLAQFTPFYLAPIMLAAFFLDAGMAYSIATLAAIEGMFVYRQLLSHSDPLLMGFDLFSKSAIFLTVAFLILQLRKLLNQLDEQASVDCLTKANTRWYFLEMSDIELARSFRYKHPVTLAFIDLDHFKQVNDTLGHRKGDQLLATAASTMKSDLREGDLLGRLGGDEFAILLNQTDQDQAKIVLERMSKKLLQAIAPMKTSTTFSIGAVTYMADKPMGIEELLARADKAMYSIKKTTRNSIQCVGT